MQTGAQEQCTHGLMVMQRPAAVWTRHAQQRPRVKAETRGLGILTPGTMATVPLMHRVQGLLQPGVST